MTPSSPTCFYRLALRLEAAADDLLALPGDHTEEADALRRRAAEMRHDNPQCWATAGACGLCSPVATANAP